MLSLFCFSVVVSVSEVLFAFPGNSQLWGPREQTQCCECGRSVWTSARPNQVSVHFKTRSPCLVYVFQLQDDQTHLWDYFLMPDLITVIGG